MVCRVGRGAGCCWRASGAVCWYAQGGWRRHGSPPHTPLPRCPRCLALPQRTSTGSARISRRSSVLSMLPSGLLGLVRNTILGLCSATARFTPAAGRQAAACASAGPACGAACGGAACPAPPAPQPRCACLPACPAPPPRPAAPSTSILNPSRRGTVTTPASLTAASNTYMVKVGGQSTITSPGSSTHRISRSMSSSAPQPTWVEGGRGGGRGGLPAAASTAAAARNTAQRAA